MQRLIAPVVCTAVKAVRRTLCTNTGARPENGRSRTVAIVAGLLGCATGIVLSRQLHEKKSDA